MHTALRTMILVCLRGLFRLRFGILSTDDGMALQYCCSEIFQKELQDSFIRPVYLH